MTMNETNQSWPAHIDASGRLLIPAEARHAIGCDRGTDVVVESDGDSLRVLTLDQFTKEVQGLFGVWKPGEPLMSEQLIRERKKEAERERRS
ncbi:MAG: AbrB/MazE/SpoVT family DNA-binding domain-containing protein [Planctomycetes bacterium]|nr:AbrB/MazE/SpoVT family DNA-binding domain-containing protein [Planctomycetota bacterium]